MESIVCGNEIFYLKEYQYEKDFERDVVANYRHIFGNNTVYIDVKRRIGDDKIVTIPDGYLLDFTFLNKPRLYIIENELSVHDAYNHIGSQLLKFAVSYKPSGRKIKQYILDYLANSHEQNFVESKISQMGYRNIDALLESLIFERPVAAIVIIDNISNELENVLSQLSIKIDILEFKTYENTSGKKLYRFIPFNNEIKELIASSKDAGTISVEKLDTIVVPAQEDGFQSAFIESNAWWQIRISVSMLDKIKYIAAYRTAPISAITHIAEVQNIERYGDTNKYILYFKGPAKEIKHIKLDENKKGLAPQAPRYTNYEKLLSAKFLSEVF